MKQLVILLCIGILSVSCRNQDIETDASGTFEAIETIISSETSGIIKLLNIEEGKFLKAGDLVGYIDSTQLSLKKKQLESQIRAVLSKNPEKQVQLAVLEEQLKQAKHELERVKNLYTGGAATQKQVDDANAAVSILTSQYSALRSSLQVTSTSLDQEIIPLRVQIEQLEDQISKCRLINPVDGIVLTQYVRQNEMAVTGKPLYKIADTRLLTLKAYVTGNQLPKIKTGQTIKVLTDDGNGGYKEYKGNIEWISEKAEFTPKTIQTKDERANLVYAVKIGVPNDGYLKIGMYGEVLFN